MLRNRILQRARKRRRQDKGTKAASKPTQDVVKSDAELTTNQIETIAVQGLGLFFTLILIDGLVLALAVRVVLHEADAEDVQDTNLIPDYDRHLVVLQGFLPEGVDQFATDVLYPSFSPTVLAFLGCSSLYGLWKVLHGLAFLPALLLYGVIDDH